VQRFGIQLCYRLDNGILHAPFSEPASFTPTINHIQNSKLSPAPPHSAAEALEFQQSRGGDTERHRHRQRAAAAHYLDIIGLEIDEDEVPNHETEAKTPSESHHTQHCTHDSHDENDPSSQLLQAAS